MAKWKPFDLTWGRSIYYCSECEESVDLPTAMGKPIYKYCPMCGAKMNADRKTENSSEIPNNCEDLQDWKDRMWAEAIVTEPTISKMEQVDEPQTERSSE